MEKDEAKEEIDERLKELKEINNLQRKKYKKLLYLVVFGNLFLLAIFTVILWMFGFFG